jgi:hypothetical protein
MVRLFVLSLGLLCMASFCIADDTKVPLKTELPVEILAGTPPSVLAALYPDLEMPSADQPPLMVPKGTVNVSLKKKVTSSDANPILGELSFVTDGKKDGDEDSYVELSPGLQWVQIDLEKPAEIYAIYLWHYFREARSYRDVIVQVSDDEKFAKDVTTIYNNDTDASAKMGIGKNRAYIETNLGMLIDAKGAKGRYVRLYSKGSTASGMNHYVEVEVFGKAAK